jgi:chaperonin cofactor prefoldin
MDQNFLRKNEIINVSAIVDNAIIEQEIKELSQLRRKGEKTGEELEDFESQIKGLNQELQDLNEAIKNALIEKSDSVTLILRKTALQGQRESLSALCMEIKKKTAENEKEIKALETKIYSRLTKAAENVRKQIAADLVDRLVDVSICYGDAWRDFLKGLSAQFLGADHPIPNGWSRWVLQPFLFNSIPALTGFDQLIDRRP